MIIQCLQIYLFIFFPEDNFFSASEKQMNTTWKFIDYKEEKDFLLF